MITASAPPRRMPAAVRRWSHVSAGQSVPITSAGAFAAAIAASIRAPRSPPPWRASSTPKCASIARKSGLLSSGVAHKVTGPTSAAHAVATARSTRRACTEAAPSAPSAGMSRVLAKPGSGALASTAIATGSFIAVLLRELFRIGAEEIGEPPPPHQDPSVDYPILPPAPTGGDDAVAQAQRPAHALEALTERDVFHQRDRGKAARRLERGATHEYRLVAGRNPGEPRADVHEPSDDGQQRGPALDLHVAAAPGAGGPVEAAEHDVVGIGRQIRIGMKEEQYVAGGLLGARVHLQRTSARRQDDAVGARARALDGGVAAAAVNDDHLGAERPPIGHRNQRPFHALPLLP